MGSGWAKLGFAIGGALLGGWMLGPFLGASLGTSAGFFAGSYLGNQLFPTDYKSKMPPVHDYPVQSSSIGIAIPIVLGTQRTAGNIIYLGPLQPYQIAHKAEGGKGGGGKQQVTYETRYRRSFLITICEGPASILNAWKGKKEIGLSDFTSYDGLDNSGISTLIGKSYAEYINMCLAYFEDYDLGNAQAISNFVFEVSSFLQDLVVGGYTKSLAWFSFGLSLGMDYTIPGGTNLRCVKDIAYLPNRKFLAIVDYGNLWRFNADGTPDITWDPSGKIYIGRNGAYGVLVHSDSSIFVTYTSIGASTPSMSKFTFDGTLVWEKQFCAALTSVEDQRKMIEHQTNIIATCSSTWPEGEKGVGVHIDVDGNELNRYVDTNWEDQNLTAYDVAVDSNENIYIGHSRGISKFALDGTWERNNLAAGGPNRVRGIAVAKVNGVDKIFITTSPWSNKCIFRMDTDLTVEKEYNLGGSTAYTIKVYQSSVYVGTNPAPNDKDIWKFDLDLNLITSAQTAASGAVYAISIFGGNSDFHYDMNFASMIKALLTDPRYGNYNESDLITEDFASVISYCEVNNLKGSLILKEQKPLPDWIAYICSHFQGYFYEIGGKIGLNCYRVQDSVLSLTQDDLIREGEDPPIHITKRKYEETFNRLDASWSDRSKDYKTVVVPAFDRIDQREAGQVRAKTMDLKAITNDGLASKMAWRVFIDQFYRFSQYTFKLGYKSMLLEVGDVIDVTDGHILTAKKMRVMTIDEEKDGRKANISAIEDIANLYPAISYSTQQTEYVGDPDIVLTDGTIVFREGWNDAKLYLSIIPGSDQCNGHYIYMSYDDGTYELVGRSVISGITGGDANSIGTIQSNLPAYTAVIHRKTEAFNVSIGTLTDLDTAISDDDFFNNRKLARIDNEIIGYLDCVESIVEGTWQVTNLIRGLFGTEPVAHISGETFNTLDIDFVYKLQDSEIGKTLYFKIVSFYADEVQSVADVSSQSYQIQGVWKRPAAVSLLRLSSNENEGGVTEYEGSSFTLYWNLPGQKGTGFNQGGFDLNNTYPEWRYGDDLSKLIGGNGIQFDNYLADGMLQGIDLVFEKTDGTFISQRSVAPTAQSVVVSKTDDLGGNTTAVIKVYPRRTQRSEKAKSLIVTGV